MFRPKKVAIIGAGPSGLVAAKTLLHNFPKGTFSPTIFEKSHEIGGLWPIDPPATAQGDANPGRSRRDGFVDPSMRTNQSRFTVAFSDLAWESVFDGPDIPMFPQAWQAGRYLQKYFERYIPKEVLRLGHEVVGSVRETRVGSTPSWTINMNNTTGESSANQKLESETFDYLIVASGYFSRPYAPYIPGLADFAEKTIHSSAIHTKEDICLMLENCGATKDGSGKLVVIGGSMSGVETATALALYLSSMRSTLSYFQGYEVHHICSRPFWTVPTYLPHAVSKDDTQERSVHFLPLDLVLNDLARRPHGPVQYNFGPVSREQAAKVNRYFISLLGKQYADSGHMVADPRDGTSDTQPSWVAIGDDYAGYVQSGLVQPMMGRVLAVNCPQSGLASIDIKRSDGNVVSLQDVTAVILATGFTPFASLSFLQEDVLSKLEFSGEDPYVPLILDGKGISNAEIPDIGFVGLYRGPFWGVVEMQARRLAESWYRADSEQGIRFSAEELEDKAQERQNMRDYRNVSPSSRGQFPMGDYVGLMETFARDLGIDRVPLSETGERLGPVVPARYMASGQKEPSMLAESRIVMASLRDTLTPGTDTSSIGLTRAIFRALLGNWNFSRVSSRYEAEVTGTASFSSTYPANPKYEKEYIYSEGKRIDGVLRSSDPLTYRLGGTGANGGDEVQISVLNRDLGIDLEEVPQISHELKLEGPPRPTPRVSGYEEYVVRARGCISSERDHLGREYSYEYVFRLTGAAISSWECRMEYRKIWNDGGENLVGETEWRRTVYWQ
ncbi:uncharacterized protein BDW43DRAFT_313037 [Aspergillus alliaceus]|uniref:uncharacterized protein n=1 Tax=Petromyces alliaceus TaxID=209559 RepID=UPI0012A44BB9|nr:uncharacterized protein BDW43DRAFT_313037 [Aspergillus alliaceus]KAB8231518.1 hypothetical protein BDW43DRAFT_313037 [Aspergillus alliaceus]